ncbi:hypothetical protein R1sor_024456 [Riccia sorocarpa]|uniref:Uncharacterized protein n=1 Tax=Riccia sorocarpa TaxID=122646 RepID=A0ABD3GTS1_9MARC
MARLCAIDSVSSGFAGIPKNGTSNGGRMVCVARVIFSGAKIENPALWRNKALSFKPRIWRRRSSFSLQECTSDGCSYRLISALDDSSAENSRGPNYGSGKAAYDTLDYASCEEPGLTPDDRSITDPTCAEPSLSSTSSADDINRVSAEMAESPLNNTEAWPDSDYSLRRSSDDSGRDSCSSSSEKAVYRVSGDYNGTGKPLPAAVESSASPFDGGQRNETLLLESPKPAYVSLVWEAGAKIEGVKSDAGQEGIVSEDRSLSLVVDEEYRARKDGTILHSFWIWSRDSGSHFWSWGQSVINSIVFSLWNHSRRWNAIWNRALSGAQIPRRLSEAREVWSSLGEATQGTVWLPREDDTFDRFCRNMSEIQKNILQMTAVRGKLAWIRLQQHFYRKLLQLEEILSSFPKSEEELDPREAELLAYADKLLTQAKINQEAYVNSQRALSSAEEMVLGLQSQVDELKEEVASRDNLLQLLKKEGILSSQSLQRAAESLSEAEKKIIELETRVHVNEEIILKEREKLAAMRKTAVFHENALRASEQKAAELAKELASMKGSVDSSRRAEQLTQQVKALEHELKSRDLLLLEIKEDTIRSTDALKLAAQIKQDLNATRQRELQLTQSLEAAHQKVWELEQQLTRNDRATRAEEVLKQTQKMLTESKAEVDFLRQGVEARDNAISIMKDEVDNNIALLSSAAQNREELRNMNRYIRELKMELESRETKLSMMREEMALIINLARKQQSSSQSPSRPENVSSTPPPPSPVQVLQESKPRKKTSVRKPRETGTSSTVRKPTVKRRSSKSPPRTS